MFFFDVSVNLKWLLGCYNDRLGFLTGVDHRW